MANCKIGKFIIVGAFVGAIASMFDKDTREQTTKNSQRLVKDIKFYGKNPDVLKKVLQLKSEKYKPIYEQLVDDVKYIKIQVHEMKMLTPQVKELVLDTKDTFIESKDEYKAIVNEASE